MSRLQAKRRMKNLLMFVPNMIALCGRLIVDERVPRTEKLLFAGAIVYAVMPLDFIPDVLPFVGQIDDAYLIALTLVRLINRTDALVVREHWRGGGDVVQLTEAIASVAPALLPRRVERVLSARVEAVPEKEGEPLANWPNYLPGTRGILSGRKRAGGIYDEARGAGPRRRQTRPHIRPPVY